ncbi:MAG: SDR family oxidoreductase [Bacteroidota bacterium]|nr:SDR family oxidoreductase [Bacteroidota bacterium]
MNFENKVIVICGASKGIGFNLAQTIDALGGTMILHASSDEGIQKLKETFKSNKHVFFQANFAEPTQLEQAWQEQIGSAQKVDGFVNCVGLRSRRPINLLKSELVLEVLSANFVSHIEMIRILTKKNAYNAGLSIIGISSIAAHSGGAGVTAYAASKAAMEAATRCLAKELHKKQIRLNTIVCGQIHTEAYDALMETKTDSDQVLERQFMGLGKPQEVTDIILFLLGAQSRFITGASIPADGGYLV